MPSFRPDALDRLGLIARESEVLRAAVAWALGTGSESIRSVHEDLR